MFSSRLQEHFRKGFNKISIEVNTAIQYINIDAPAHMWKKHTPANVNEMSEIPERTR